MKRSFHGEASIVSRVVVVFLALGVFFGVTASVLAQSILFSSDPKDALGVPAFLNVWLEYEPKTPGPNEVVKARVFTYSRDLETADIAWFVDGRAIAAGKGVVTASFSTGKAGIPMTIRVVAKFADGTPLDYSVALTPSAVALVWEASSYTPPFYRGKALRGPNQPISLVAIPSFAEKGVPISPSSLRYEWFLGPRKLPESGIGAQRVTLPGDSFAVYPEVRLVVSTLDWSSSAEIIEEIPAIFPKVVIYEKDLLYGRRYERAVRGQHSMSANEATFVAEPYHFERTSVANGKVWANWQMNGATTTSGFEKTFVRPGSISGSTNISVVARDASEILMAAVKTFSVRFGSNGAL